MTHDPRQAPEPRQAHERKGLVIVHTGDGKGKTTAALGIMTRAWGHGMRVCVIQFIKKEGARVGEQRAAEKMGIEFLSSGDGFTWRSRDLDESAARARHGWQMAQERIASGQYDIIILDEMTYPLNYGWLDLPEVLTWLRANKPPMLHLVITGRDAPQALIDYADLATEMRLVKHPYDEQGIKAQPGIEF
jgi:cob(I)alamin adenosyltransferase